MLDTSPEENGVYCLMDGTTEPFGTFQYGPWGINDYLHRCVTKPHEDGRESDNEMMQSMPDNHVDNNCLQAS